MTEGGLPPLISLACSRTTRISAQLSQRCGIAADAESRIKIVDEGGLEPLASVRASNVKSGRLPNVQPLAMNEGNKLIMVEHEVLPDIIRRSQKTRGPQGMLQERLQIWQKILRHTISFAT